MRKSNITVSLLSVCVILLWLMFFFAPNITLIGEKELLQGCPKDIRSHLNIAYVAAGALFTAIAFIGTLWINLKIHKNAIRASSLDGFLNVFEKIQNEKKFNDARKYVLDRLPQDLQILKETGQTIGLKEIKSIKINNNKDDKTTAYNHIMYFCGKMEYFGLLLKNRYIEEESILDYFGDTIINSYKNVKAILEVEQNRRKDITYYIHYAYLNDVALKRKPDFKKACKKMRQKFAKQ